MKKDIKKRAPTTERPTSTELQPQLIITIHGQI